MISFNKVVSVAKKNAEPVIYSIGRLISNPGTTMFVIQKNINYLSSFFQNDQPQMGYTFANNSWSPFIFSCYFFPVISNISINLTTRIPALFRARTEPAAEREIVRAPEVQFAYNACYSALSKIGLLSVFFAYPSAYLGGLKLIGWMAPGANLLIVGTTLVQLGAHFTAFANFKTNLSFTLPNFKKGTKQFLNFVFDDTDKLKTIKSYGLTFIICSFNILSDPCITYFGSLNAFQLMPGLNLILSLTAIKYIAICSAITSFSSNIFTSIPSVHAYINRQTNSAETAKVDAVRQTSAANTIYSSVIVMGYIDSLATGLNSFISVITTAVTIFGIYEKAHSLIIFAAICALSKAITNQAFSVVRGLNNTMVEDVYPFYVKQGWIQPVPPPPPVLPPPVAAPTPVSVPTAVTTNSSSTVYQANNRSVFFSQPAVAAPSSSPSTTCNPLNMVSPN